MICGIKGLFRIYELQGIKADPKTGRADPRQFLGFKVKYLNKTERKDYEMGMSGGQITQQGKPFDTTDHVTVAQGKGWAIYVMSPNGEFYSASHQIGRFHHSSFLAGGAVAGAGEWVVKNGRLIEINGKTGHYQAGRAEMFQVLCELEERGFNLKGIPMTLFGSQSEDAYKWKQDNKDVFAPKPDNQSNAYNKTPNEYEQAFDNVGDNKDGAAIPQSTDPTYAHTPAHTPNIENGPIDLPSPNTSKEADETSADYKHDPVPEGGNQKSDTSPTAKQSIAEPAKQVVDQHSPVPGASQPAGLNTVMGHTGIVVSQAMVQAIRNDILATGLNSKWADQAEIIALAKAMGIRIDIEGPNYGGQYGNSGRIYYLKYNGADHYDAYLQVAVDPQTDQPHLQAKKILGNGDCFYQSISEIHKSYEGQTLEVSAMRELVNRTLTDEEVADMVVGLKSDYPNGGGLGANFRQLMQSGAENHIFEKASK
jgi:hypothetical protein